MVKSTGNTAAALPEGVRRDYLLELVEKLRNELRLSPNSIIYLRTIARKTAHADWYNSLGDGPRCYVKQSDLAAEVNITRRSANRIERRLETIGLIKIVRADNHHRSGPSANIGLTGIFLAPMISLFSALEDMMREKEERFIELKTERARASCAKAALRRMLNENNASIPSELYEKAWFLIDTLPSRISQIASLSELRDISQKLKDMTLALTPCLNRCLPPPGDENISITKETSQQESHATDPSVTLHIHNTYHDHKVICNAENKENAPLRDETPKNNTQLTDSDINPVNSDIRTNTKESSISVELASSAASAEFQYYLNASRNGSTTTEDIKFAASMRRRELLVSDHAWNTAGEMMGYPRRAIALLILDQNRSHPTHPVRNPSGALLGMVKKAKTSDLHLAKSVIGILKRESHSHPDGAGHHQ